MIVVGFKQSGKSSIIKKLGTKREHTEAADGHSPTSAELDISSFVLEDRVKVMAF